LFEELVSAEAGSRTVRQRYESVIIGRHRVSVQGKEAALRRFATYSIQLCIAAFSLMLRVVTELAGGLLAKSRSVFTYLNGAEDVESDAGYL
jgi:hypothetical protein